jgi:hypothetical protein
MNNVWPPWGFLGFAILFQILSRLSLEPSVLRRASRKDRQILAVAAGFMP